MKHLLSISDLGRDGIEDIFRLTDSFVEVSERNIPKVPALRGRTVVSLFYEDSTRTRLSFETAAKRLSADTMSFSVGRVVGEQGRVVPRHGRDDPRDGRRRDRRASQVVGRAVADRRLGRRVDRERRRRLARAPDPGAARLLHDPRRARSSDRGPARRDRRRHQALARRTIERARARRARRAGDAGRAPHVAAPEPRGLAAST